MDVPLQHFLAYLLLSGGFGAFVAWAVNSQETDSEQTDSERPAAGDGASAAPAAPGELESVRKWAAEQSARNAALEAIEGRVAQLDEITARLDDREEDLREARDDIASRDHRIRDMAMQHASIESRKDTEIQRLRKRVSALEADLRRAAAATRSNAVPKAGDALGAGATQKAQASAREDQLRRLEANYRRIVDDRDLEIGRLRREMRRVRAAADTAAQPGTKTPKPRKEAASADEPAPAKSSSSKPKSPKSPPAKPTPAKRRKTGIGKVGAAADTPFARPGSVDDLKEISGIGPVFEQRLNRMGYFSYDDVARWKSDDIDRVARELGSFPDRIRRDDWMAQARELHRTKHDEET